jgi:hypothetical protein
MRGLGAPLRMMGFYSGRKNIQYIDYDGGDPNSSDYKQAWFRIKPAMATKNPMLNLPHVHSGNTCIVQTNACMYHLGRKFKLDGDTNSVKDRIDQVVAQAMDLRNSSISSFYGRKTVEENQTYIREGLTTAYQKLNSFMNHNGTTYTADNQITLSDFHIWEMLDQHENWFSFLGVPSILPKFDALKKMYELMKNEPRLALYFQSTYYKDYAMNNPHATFLH